MSWADYGFPDTTMMPCYLPAKALQLAYAERETIVAGQESSIADAYTPNLFVEENGRHFTQGSDGMFGGHCWTIPGTYINHLLDLDKPVAPVGMGGPALFFREEQDIKPIIEAADTTGLGYLDPHMFFSQNPLTMMPEWTKTWLEQRYLALNLLRMAEAPFTVTRRHGNSGSNWFATPQLAHDHAVANSAAEELPGDWPLSHLSMYTTIYERTGLGYSCDFRVIDRVAVDYSKVPHLAGLPAYIYVGTAAGTIWDDGHTFDNHGFPIRDGEGIVTKIPLPWESEGIAQPAGGLTAGSFGYTIRQYTGAYRKFFWQYAGVDVSSRFQFYDDVDAIAAGAA